MFLSLKKLLILFLLTYILLGISIVKAYNKVDLNYKEAGNIWYTRRGGGKPYSSLPLMLYNVLEQTVYCIQPGVEITTDTYLETEGFSFSPYSESINRQINLIGYYGYDYPGHNSLRYRIATQALIWELVSGQIVEFWTEPYGYGNYINVDFEKAEIMDLVNIHNIEPNFSNEKVEAKLGEEIVLLDKNKVLDKYEVSETDNIEVKIEEDKLYIKPLKAGRFNVVLKRKVYNDKTYIYKGQDGVSQMVGHFGISESDEVGIDILSKGKIELTKLGESIEFKGKELEYKYIPLGNVEFSLYASEDIKNVNDKLIYKKDSLIKSDKTNIGGKIVFDDLYLGKYKVKETRSLEGYKDDNREYEVYVAKDIVSLVIKNELEKVVVEAPNTIKNNYSLYGLIMGFGLIIGAKII